MIYHIVFIVVMEGTNFGLYATARSAHHWSRGAGSGRYANASTASFCPSIGRRSMRVAVVESRRAQSSLDRCQVCVVDRCTRLPLCVDSAWFFVRLDSFFPFSLFFPPFQFPIFFSPAQTRDPVCYMLHARASRSLRSGSDQW